MNVNIWIVRCTCVHACCARAACGARVAQLALTCKFDNSRGQLNGTRELLAGISRERVTLLVNGTVFEYSCT